MHLSLIQEGEELHKVALCNDSYDKEVVKYFLAYAKELLEAARWAVNNGYRSKESLPKFLDVGEDWGMGETKPGD